MKKIQMILTAMAVCFFLAFSSNVLVAQDARDNTTMVDDDDEDDNGDWGLLGLLGLIGLMGLKKKDRDVMVDDRNRTSSGNVNR